MPFGHRQDVTSSWVACGSVKSVKEGDWNWTRAPGWGLYLRRAHFTSLFILYESRACQGPLWMDTSLKALMSCWQLSLSGAISVWSHHGETSFWVPGADVATTTGVLRWVFLVVRSQGWLTRQSQCSRIMLVDQVGQLKNSLKYLRGMFLFCIVFKRINIPRPWYQKRELCDF